MEQKQIFQSNTRNRWLTFIWTSRSLIIALLIALGCVAYTISSIESPALPYFTNNTPLTEKALSKLKKSQQYRDFKIQKSKLEQIKKDRNAHELIHTDNKRLNLAFYVSWAASQKRSLADLRKNIVHLDVVATESFFIRPDHILSQPDTAALQIIRKAGKKALAVVSNYNKNQWDGEVVRNMLSNENSQQKFIQQLKELVKKNGFSGINIDFEELNLTDPSLFTAFMSRLYEQFHNSGLMVTQDISPENDDYNPKELAKYNDYLILMAYDQHTEQSNAGDVSHQEWVEEKLDNICKQIDPEKVILALACYGYDWPENSVGNSLTYEEAILTANANKASVYFDPESANLNYQYKDVNGIKHNVHFTDAATYYNIIRKADDWGVAGIALWRLGSEDKRIWTFINTNLSIESLKKKPFDLRKLSNPIMNGIAYIGDGEILDLISTPSPGLVRFTIDPSDKSITGENYLRLPSQYVIKRFGEADKKIALTFDDGPDPVYTPQIMDILAKNKIPGCFFVVGLMAEKNMELLRRQYNDGYEIGNHTFFHPDMSTIGPNRVNFELNATRRLIECVTGHSTILFRAPFNADAEPQNISEILPVAQSRKENYVNIGEFIDPQDWQPGKTSDQIYNEVVKQYDNGNILLLHDAGGNRQATVDALPRIIDFYKKKGYTFVSVGELMGKKRAQIMPVASSLANGGIVGSTDYFFISFFYYANIVLDIVFTTAIIMAILRTLLIAYLAIRQRQKSKLEAQLLTNAPTEKVSIIIPAYNEEITVINSIQSLLEIDYPDFELIFVDDGSKDNTFKLVASTFGKNPKVKAFSKPNGGKASALNFGITHASSNYLVCIDADTQLRKDAIKELMRFFSDENTAAVAGTVKVGNTKNLITQWQSIEYVTSQNMDRRAFDLLNTITVVPGAIGAFRKNVVLEVGGFTTDTLAEDCDLTMRVLRAGYKVRNCASAIAYTEAPETINMLLKQRFRWSFGVMQSFWKNKDTLFNKKYGYFGFVGMPNILFYQIVLPIFSPLADLFMVISMISGLFSLAAINNLTLSGFTGLLSPQNGFAQVLFYYLLFILVDIIFAAIAFKMEGMSYKRLIYIFPQRFFWRQLMYIVLFRALRKAIKGELSQWGALKRTGNVKTSDL